MAENDNKKNREELAEIRRNDFTIELDDQANPRIMLITIPIGRCANNVNEGSFIIRGAFDEYKSMALNFMRQIRNKKSKWSPSVVGPDGKPLGGIN